MGYRRITARDRTFIAAAAEYGSCSAYSQRERNVTRLMFRLSQATGADRVTGLVLMLASVLIFAYYSTWTLVLVRAQLPPLRADDAFDHGIAPASPRAALLGAREPAAQLLSAAPPGCHAPRGVASRRRWGHRGVRLCCRLGQGEKCAEEERVGGGEPVVVRSGAGPCCRQTRAETASWAPRGAALGQLGERSANRPRQRVLRASVHHLARQPRRASQQRPSARPLTLFPHSASALTLMGVLLAAATAAVAAASSPHMAWDASLAQAVSLTDPGGYPRGAMPAVAEECKRSAFSMLSEQNSTCLALTDVGRRGVRPSLTATRAWASRTLTPPPCQLAAALAQCHLALSGRELLPCRVESGFDISCTQAAGGEAFATFTAFYTHAEAMCLELQQSLWREATERLVHQLQTSASALHRAVCVCSRARWYWVGRRHTWTGQWGRARRTRAAGPAAGGGGGSGRAGGSLRGQPAAPRARSARVPQPQCGAWQGLGQCSRPLLLKLKLTGGPGRRCDAGGEPRETPRAGH